MKYKIGDKVKLREDLIVGDKYSGLTYLYSMKEELRGKGNVATITNVNVDTKGVIGYDLKGYGYTYSEEMIEGLVEESYRRNFEECMRKLSKLDSKDDVWQALDRLTYLEADNPDDKKDFEHALKLVADYLFGEEKKKMTKAEIEAELGYEIEIVEE